MKRVGQLFDGICSVDALHKAYLQASKNKRSHRACFLFSKNLGANIHQLHEELTSGRYRPHLCNRFWVQERKKPRLIEAPAFRDLVVQHAVYAAIMPTLDARYIDTNFACRVDKGTHKAADWLQGAMRVADRGTWLLHVDVRKFFYSINRDILRGLLSRFIKCTRTVDLMMLFATRPEPRGVPIGNLLSQTFANVYLNSLDHYCKRQLKARHYGRYMDDSIMLAPSREVAAEWLLRIEEHLMLLDLEISHYSLQPIKRGANFVGYRTWASARFVRPRLINDFRRDAKRGRLDSLVSRLGHANKTCSFHPLVHYLKEKHHDLFDRLPQSHRRRYDAHAPTP